MTTDKSTIKMTERQFELLPRVFVTSNVGPCLTYYRALRQNKITWTVVFRNGDGFTQTKKYISQVHRSPCSLCWGGASYPDGYRD